MAEIVRPLGEYAPSNYGNMTLGRAAALAEDPEIKKLLMTLARRVKIAEPEMARFREWSQRADELYYAEHFTAGGADLWWNDPSATTPGRAHVSLNMPAPIVDIPASLQAVEPIENMLPTDQTKEARDAANAMERIYYAWKADEDFELKFHKIATVKALYGRAAARVYWEPGDEDDATIGGHPTVEIIDQPRNLYLGYQSDRYDELEWAAYVTRMDPNAVVDTYGVNVIPIQDEITGKTVPFVSNREDPYESDYQNSRSWLELGDAMVEVWDYWYRVPTWKRGKFAGMTTYNLVMCGNYVLRPPTPYKEYGGELPYIVVFNTYIPGVPTGRPELYDAEHIIREMYEKLTAGSQMISNAVAGDYWQLTGENAPSRVDPTLKPKRNQLVAPGPGNRIETITPFIAQVQLDQYLGRLDRYLAIITGLNDLLLGLAPAQVLSSSKAINALIANYESRLAMRRKLLYKFRSEVWEKCVRVWAKKDEIVREIVKGGGGRLDIVDPSLSPRDDMETAQRAINLMSAKVWSQARAMDVTGVDDPEAEMNLIREESTDAALWPERVQVMAQLMGALQSLGIQAPQNAQAQAQGQVASSQETLRQALQGGTPENTPGMQSPDTQGMTPPIPGAPPEAGGAFQQPQDPALMQGMIQGGQAKGRIMTQQKLQPPARRA